MMLLLKDDFALSHQIDEEENHDDWTQVKAGDLLLKLEGKIHNCHKLLLLRKMEVVYWSVDAECGLNQNTKKI